MENTIPLAVNGFIATLNNMGFMTESVDEYTQEFISFACQQNDGLPLELGAAYGLASREIVKHGKTVITNDLDVRHLNLFKSTLPEKQQQLVTLMPGDIVKGLPITKKTLSSVLSCRVFHFFTGDILIGILNEIYEWLIPGGQIFIITETPYLKNFSSFLPIFEKRKCEGFKFPGEVYNVFENDPIRGASLPPMMHFFDADTISALVKSVGFEILKCNTFARPEFPVDIRLDGRESVGLVGRKPL